jgi:hypothetical protein
MLCVQNMVGTHLPEKIRVKTRQQHFFCGAAPGPRGAVEGGTRRSRDQFSGFRTTGGPPFAKSDAGINAGLA